METFDRETFNYLRKKTRLKRKERRELLELELNTIKAIKKLNEIEHSTLGINTDSIDELEFEYRMNAMQRKLCGLYLQDGKPGELLDYTKKYIAEDIQRIKERKQRRQMRRSMRKTR